ncbi:Nibrin like protein [Argiope bruennichi]|uniref:Nibrin like protein n=2 Tax=Argiope bruennichi TaxID=94029 RepID=A0A8T0E9S6_ARGBR|nr:Nibrin like protein [Argiope bruennichi]
MELQNKDVVKFGQFESEFRIYNLPLVVTTSCLEISAKKDLRKTVHFLGGNLISEWQPSCTHLVMTEVKVTVKALCCLVSAKPIVKPEYFQELHQSLKNSAAFLSPKQFVPPIGEALIDKDVVSFNVNLQRKTIFKDKTFFFLDEKQFKKLHLGIILGGGNASILSTDKITPEILLRNGCCIIEPTQQNQEFGSMLSSVKAILQKKEYRLIPESDIGLSVAYCSTDKFCNPQFNMVETLLSQKMQSQTLTQREVYVPDTQERTTRIENKSRNPVSDALSSLHLSSFQNDPVENMEISEIPLSAEIKQELDDIFEEPLESKNEAPSKMDSLASTLPLPTPDRLSKQEKKNTENYNSLSKTRPLRGRRTTSHENENLVPNKILKQENEMMPEHEIDSPLKRNGIASSNEIKHSTNFNSSPEMKQEIPLTSIQTNGFHMDEVNLPRNLAKVQFASLIRRKPTPVIECSRNSTVKNFKKFKKVQPKKSQTLPRIIGSHELVAYDKVAAEISAANWDEPDEPLEQEEESQPVKGEFDW